MGRGIGSAAGYNQKTLIVCFVMIIIVFGAAAYIINYGFTNTDRDAPLPTTYMVFYELYAEETNVAGTLTVYSGTEVFVILNVNSTGGVFGVPVHPVGDYSVYYVGSDNNINFGPVTFTVNASNTILVDQEYFGVRLTVKTL